MPKKTTATKPKADKAPAPSKTPPKAGRVKKYDGIEVNGVRLDDAALTLTYDQVKEVMGWETEDEYVTRRAADGVGPVLAKAEFDKLWQAMAILDGYQKKAVCHRNSNNRPFDLATSRGYTQDHLFGRFLLNGEAFIVDEFGEVISGQHRGVGFILAVQEWRKDTYWRKYWAKEPVFRTVIVRGVPGTQEVRATLDNVRPRQLSDTIYTSETFADLDAAGRRECSKMLDAAVDLLWKRTGAAFAARGNKQTHQASHDFLDRHPKLVQAVRHLFNQNKERAVSLAKLSPGQCGALMYLMAAAGSDGRKYREGDPPAEKLADLRYWDKAKDFWAMFAAKAAALVPLLNCLSHIVNGNYGTLELNDKKLAAVVNAWGEWVAGTKVTAESVKPACLDLGTAECKLDVDKLPVCGGTGPDGSPVGIDLGCRPERDDDTESEADVEQKKEDLARKLAGSPAAVGAVADALKKWRGLAAGRLLLWANGEGGWTAFDEDADSLAAVLGTKTKDRPDGLRMAKAPKGTDLETLASQLRVKGGKHVTVVAEDGKTATDLHPSPAPALKGKEPPEKAPAAKAPPAAANGKPASDKTAPAAAPAKGKLKLRGGIGSGS